MIRPVYCRTSGKRIGSCKCIRCQLPASKESQQ